MKAKAVSIIKSLLYLLLFLFCIAMSSVVFFLLGLTEFAALFAAFLGVGALCLIKRKHADGFRECFSINPVGLKTVAIIIGLTIIATLLVQSIQLIMPLYYREQVPQFTMPHGFFSVISVAVTSPIVEEVYFRGFILKGLTENFPPAAAVIISSFLFSGLHDGVIWGITAFFISIFYSVLFIRYKSIYAPIIAHLTSNCIALTFNAFVLGLG